MALFNYAAKELTLKVVYYGPGLSGKTTNLQYLHSKLEPKKKGKLISLATESDRTLFFDFLPVELGRIRDFRIKFQLYTVPGQVRYDATRKLVLKGADAVVFVADSQRQMRESNIESFENMRENLEANNIAPDTLPTVLQYNKRDLRDILSVRELDEDLNRGGYEAYEAVAIDGTGVEETFKAVTRLLIKDFTRRFNVQFEKAKTAAFAEEVVSEAAKLAPAAYEPAQQAMAFEPPAASLPPISKESPEALREKTAELMEAVPTEGEIEPGIEKETMEPPWKVEEKSLMPAAEEPADLYLSTSELWLDESHFARPPEAEEAPEEVASSGATPSGMASEAMPEELLPAEELSPEETVVEETTPEEAAAIPAETGIAEEAPGEAQAAEEEPYRAEPAVEKPAGAEPAVYPPISVEPSTEPFEVVEPVTNERFAEPRLDAGSLLGAIGDLKEEVHSALSALRDSLRDSAKARTAIDRQALQEMAKTLETSARAKPAAADSAAEIVSILREMKRDQAELLQAIRDLRRDIALASTRRKKRFGIFG